MEAVYNFITGSSLTLYLLGFLAISYLIVGLLTWSIIKPLKYLGFPIIIVGLVSFALKSILKFVVDKVLEDEIPLITIFINSSGNIFMKYAIICLVIGVIMVVSYFVLNKVLKAQRKKKNSEYAVPKSHAEEYIPESYDDDIASEAEDEVIDD